MIVYDDKQIYISKKEIDGKTFYETKYHKLDELGIDHGYFSSKDFHFLLSQYDKKEFEKYLEKDLTNLNVLKLEHGDNIEEVTIENAQQNVLLHADGLKTNKSFPMLTTSADCISYIVYDKQRNILYNVHSGWKSTYKRIVIKAVKELLESGSNSEDIYVFSFPAILKCHFQVKDDVYSLFDKLYDDIIERYGKEKIQNEIKEIQKEKYISNYTIDLVGFNTLELKLMGIENIYDSNMCTVCMNDIFNSNRKGNDNRNILYCRLSKGK